MAEKKSWRDYLDSVTDNESSGKEKTGTWRDLFSGKATESEQASGGWRNQLKSAATGVVANEVTSRVNSWLTNHNTYISDYQNRYSGRKYNYEDAYVSDSASWLDTASKRKSDYDTEADNILSYMDQYKDYLDADWMNDVKKTIADARKQQGTILESYTKDNEWWSLFTPNEEQTAAGYTSDKVYKEWQEEQKQYAEDQAYDVEAGMLELEELKKGRDAYLAEQEEKRKQAQKDESFWDSLGRWLGTTPDTTLPLAGVSNSSGNTNPAAEYDKQIAEFEDRIERAKYVQGYEGYMTNMAAEDYAANSKYVSTRTDVAMDDARWGVYNNMYDESKLFGDYLYDYINRNEDALAVAMVNNTATDAYFLGIDQGFLQELEDEEIGVYNYIYNTQGKDAANEYLSFLESDLQGRRRVQEQAFWAGYAKEHPVKSSVFSTMISPLKGLSYLGQAADMLDDGKMDQNAGYNRFSYIPSSIRSQVSTMIERSGKWGKVGSFAYNTGMSMADFLFTTAVSGGNQALSLAIMGTGAAADATIAAKDRGLEDGEAFALGTIAGLAEVAMEKISLGAWLEGDMTEGALRYVLKNALSEGGEEAGTSIINLLADVIISGDKSEWNVAMQAYIDQGKTPEEAFGLVAAEQAAQIGLDALGGILSGAGIGGGTYAGTSVAAHFKYGSTAKNKASSQKLVSEGLELNPDSQYIKKAQSKLEKGKNLTGMQVRNILAANQEQITANDMKKIQKAAEERLTVLGQTEDVSKIAEIATKYATGGELTRAEKKLLTNSYGSRVANELLPKNIKSGGYASEWAENIGTRQVNKEAYNKELFDKWRAAVDEIAKMNDPATYKALDERVDEKDKLRVSKTGKATIRESGEEIDLSKAEVTNFITDKKTGKVTDMTLNVDGKEVKASEIDYADGDQSYLFSAVQKIENMTPGAATAFIRDYDPSSGVSVSAYLNGIDEAFTYGYHNYSEADMQAGNFTIDLSIEQAKGAYLLGQTAKNTSKTAKTDAIKRMRTAVEAETEKAKAEGKEAPKAKKMTITYNDGNGKIVDFDKAGLKLTSSQKAAPALAKVFHEMGLGTNFEMFASYVNKNGVRVFLDENGVERKAYSGVYRLKDGTVRIDLNAYSGRGLTLDVMAHELTHFMQQWSDTKYQALAEFLVQTYEKTDMTMHERVLREQARLKTSRGEDVSYNEAFDEVVANAMSKMLADGKVMDRLNELKAQDMELAQKLWEGLKKFLTKFFRIAEKQSALFYDAADLMELKAEFKQMQQMWAEAFVEASENFQANLMATEVGVEPVAVEDISQFSYSSLAEAAGFEAVENEDGTRSFTRDGKKVSKVTVEDIENSPIGAFINFSVEMKDITADDAKRQKEMFAQICTMACKTNDFAMTMQFVGSAVFTGMKANADKQYGTTYDFPSICTKTQAVIDAMSAKMVSLGRGLNTNEIVQLYEDVFASGNPVPCPECYVFSRWIGIGGLLDNIKKYQDYYGNMDIKGVADAYLKMKAEVSKFADEQGISFGKAKGALTSKLTKEFNKLNEKIEKAQNQGEKVKPADKQRLAELEPMMNTVKAMTWLENVYFADSSLKKVNPNFRVPDSVLFDLNNGEAFATQYKEAWAFRTTQGAGYGKAITPYAEARLGEGVLVTNNTTNAIKGRAQGSLDNYFLQQMGKLDKKSREALKRARMKQKIQAFIGGQRFQSTSDARYENASDYLLAALEMQAMGGMVQVYTKVDGAVPAFSAWGFSINQSLMPLNGGLDAAGNVKDTAVGGMKPEVAFENRKNHETAGTITIGVNDNHIRAMFKQWVRDFIIPYHASGGKADVVAEFRRIQEGKEAKGKAVRSTDYSRTQSDKVLSDEVLRWQGKTDAQIQRIHEIRAARIAILTGGKPNMTVVRSNRFLSALYDKLNGGEWDGVKLAKSKVESQIFPNEFWDQTVSYDESAKITKDYLEYCEDLGFLHRFSGMIPSNGKLVPANGYNENGERVQLTDLAYKYDADGNKTAEVEEFFWKVLTDRRMYDNNGKYLAQKVVTLNDTTTDTVTGFAKNNQGREYDKAKAEALAKKIVGEQYSSQETDLDSDGNKLSAEQQEFFKDSVVRDAEGKLLVVYHGTPNGSTTIFDKAKTSEINDMGQGIYFSTNKGDASSYMGKSRNKKLYSTYVNIKAPFVVSDNVKITVSEAASLLKLCDDRSMALDVYRGDVLTNAKDGYITTSQLANTNISQQMTKILEKSGKYDGIIDETVSVKFGLEEGTKHIIALNSNQIKLIDNQNPTTDPDIRYSSQGTDADRQQYNPFREKFTKERLDLLSDRLGKLFPLSAGFEQAIQNDKTPVSNMTIVANSQKRNNGESFYTVAKKAFKKLYGAKTTFSIKQLGINADADDSFARESIAKASDRKDMQTILDLTPAFKQLIEDSRLLAVERLIHNDKKEKSLLCYRLYNAYIREETYIDANGKKQTEKVPHIVVFSVIQNLADAKAYMVTDIKDVAISNGHNSSKLKAAHANGNISTANIADVYGVVKSIDRKKGGLRYSPGEMAYKFDYTQKESGEAYSSQETDADLAPTFYSKMGKVIEGIKQEKFGASSVISTLTGRGVKAEEIRWSGIHAFLDGKKSVTKQELLDFINGSMLQIEEQERGAYKKYSHEQQKRLNELEHEIDVAWDEIWELWEKEFGEGLPMELVASTFVERRINKIIKNANEEAGTEISENSKRIIELARQVDVNRKELETISDQVPETKWGQYKLDGGSNYRELLFKLPDATYSNTAMTGHWGEDAKGILAHARLQDFEVDGKKMLFIEEIQSDWHNAGGKLGYTTPEVQKLIDEFNEVREKRRPYHEKASPAVQEVCNKLGTDYAGIYHDLLSKDWNTLYYFDEFAKYLSEEDIANLKADADLYKQHIAIKEKMNAIGANPGAAPDAPFKDGKYTEFVLKRLLRLAAEEGYDSIGWTTAETQDERWANTMPHKEGTGKSGFLKAYAIEYDQDIPKFLKKYGKQWGAEVGKTRIDEGNRYTWDEDLFADDELSDDWLLDDSEQPFDGGEFAFKDGFTYSGTEVWTMAITDAMKKSVLTEGQELYSSQETDFDSKGNHLTKAQIEFFKDSVVRDDAGKLLVMYHGSQNLGFTVFDPNASDDNRSFFFSDDPGVAASYSDSENEVSPYAVTGKESGLYKTYLNLKNPYVVDARGSKWNNIVEFSAGDEFLSDIGAYMGIVRSMDYSLGISDFLDSLRGDLVGATEYAINELNIDEDTGESYFTEQEQKDLLELADRIDKAYTEWDENAHLDEDGESTSFESYVLQNYTAKTTRKIASEAYKNGYDGVIFKNLVDVGKFGNIQQQNYEKSTVAVAFDSSQIKSVDNKNPTSDPDMRYSTQETDNIDNRSLLANAFEGITQNSDEYKLIQEYKGRIKILNEYEEKLAKLNAEIRKILFDPDTERDAKKLKELQDEAKKVAENINRNDKKLLSLEASGPLRDVIERERKKEARKTKDHVKTLIKNKKDRAEQTELRHKIRKTVRDLDKILNRGNKKQNVKEDMKGFVSKALELADYLFTDHITNDELIRRGITVRMTPEVAALVKETEDILTKLYDEADSLTDEEFTNLDAKRKANEERLRDLLKAQRNEGLNTPVYNLFNDLVTEYASLKNSSQESVKAAYDEVLENSLRAFMGDEDRVKILKNMRVADMTTEELNWLYRAYTMVLTNVRNANKFHAKGITESIEQVVGQIAGDFGSRKIPEKKLAIAAQKLANKIGWDYEKLYYALDRIGSEAFTKLIMNIANSENIVMQDIIEAMAFRDQIVKNYGFNNWEVNKEIDREFMDNTGKKFKMTLGQMMSLYAYSRREGAWDHIEYGGFVFGDAALTNPRPADSYKLSKEQCEAITNLLTKEQKGYVEDMQKFLSETMGEKGNEVSMQLYGIKMFGEKNYFPIHIAGQFKAQAQESQAKAAAGFGSMSNAGFTHAQNPNAKAPFVLEGFNEVWADHVNEMSRYHGTVPALEDLRRVMNRSTYSDSVSESQSIKQLMENHYGKEAVEYFDNLYREANSGAITDKLQKKSKKLLSLFRKNSVAYSLSVLIQQPASLVRAYAMIDKKYFGFKGFGTITSGVAKAVSSKWNPAYANAYNEMMKYAPGVTMAKEIGGFDTATGGSIRSTLLDTGKSLKQKWNTGTALEKGKAVLDVVDDNAIANLPNVADKIAWIEIWNACKRETVAKRKDLAANSEEFMQAVGDRFTEVIRATQVYDSIFAKSPMLKSKNLAVQYLVSFMNEPNTIANMAESAVRSATRGDWKQGMRTGAAVIHSIIFTNVLKSIIYAMRDDDEDETYIEKYIEAIAGGMMDDFNPLNYIPIARDAWSIAQGYDVERADMAIVSDAIGAVNNVIKAAATDKDDMTEEQLIELDKKQTEANWQLVEALAAFLGIPVKNIRREIEGVIDHARIASANAGHTTALSLLDKVGDAVIDSIPFMQSKNTKQDKLYNAIISGDTEYLGRIKATYKTDSAYNSAVRKALRENDSRIHDAAQARYDGKTEEYKRIFREIQKEGKFTFDEIMDAVNSEENAIKNKIEPGKVTSTYSASDFVQAVSMGDTGTASAAMDDIIATHVANGKTQSEAEAAFASSVATSTHEALSAGLLDEAGAENMLVEYAGKGEEEAASKVSYWAFCEDNPQYEYFSESNVKDYREFAEPANISLEVYAQFLNGTKGLADIKDKWGDVEVTKREQVLEVIDSLPLTWEQKDALYLAAGYSESKIWDVPW